MSHSQHAVIWVLGATAIMLAWVGVSELKDFKVRNEFVIVLGGLYFAYAVMSGQSSTIYLHAGFAILALGGMLYLYLHEQIGGGDMKLLVVAFLWTGPWWAVPFVILVAVFIGLHYLVAHMQWISAQRIGTSLRIPLSPSVAAALIALLAVGAMAPVS